MEEQLIVFDESGIHTISDHFAPSSPHHVLPPATNSIDFLLMNLGPEHSFTPTKAPEQFDKSLNTISESQNEPLLISDQNASNVCDNEPYPAAITAPEVVEADQSLPETSVTETPQTDPEMFDTEVLDLDSSSEIGYDVVGDDVQIGPKVVDFRTILDVMDDLTEVESVDSPRSLDGLSVSSPLTTAEVSEARDNLPESESLGSFAPPSPEIAHKALEFHVTEEFTTPRSEIGGRNGDSETCTPGSNGVGSPTDCNQFSTPPESPDLTQSVSDGVVNEHLERVQTPELVDSPYPLRAELRFDYNSGFYLFM